jgi:hypothetical protein
MFSIEANSYLLLALVVADPHAYLRNYLDGLWPGLKARLETLEAGLRICCQWLLVIRTIPRASQGGGTDPILLNDCRNYVIEGPLTIPRISCNRRVIN